MCQSGKDLIHRHRFHLIPSGNSCPEHANTFTSESNILKQANPSTVMGWLSRNGYPGIACSTCGMQQPWYGTWMIVGGEESYKSCSLLFGIQEPWNIVGGLRWKIVVVGGRELGDEDEVSPDSGLSSNDGVRVASASGVAGVRKAAPKPAPISLYWPQAARPKAAPKSLAWPAAARPKAALKTILEGPPKPNAIFIKPDNPDLAPVSTIIEDNGTTIPCRWCDQNIEEGYKRGCHIETTLPLGMTPPPLVRHLSCCSGCFERFLVDLETRCMSTGCISAGRTSSPIRGGDGWHGGFDAPSSFPIIAAARAASVQAASVVLPKYCGCTCCITPGCKGRKYCDCTWCIALEDYLQSEAESMTMSSSFPMHEC